MRCAAVDAVRCARGTARKEAKCSAVSAVYIGLHASWSKTSSLAFYTLHAASELLLREQYHTLATGMYRYICRWLTYTQMLSCKHEWR